MNQKNIRIWIPNISNVLKFVWIHKKILVNKLFEEILLCKQQKTKCTTYKNTTIDLVFSDFKTTTGIIESMIPNAYHKMVTIQQASVSIEEIWRDTWNSYKREILKWTECDNLCVQVGNLKRHMRIHIGETLYKCTEWEFLHKVGHLKTHLKTHTGEKSYKCTECYYLCVQIGNLKSHMRIYTGKRFYICTECDYLCVQFGHVKRQMKEKPYKIQNVIIHAYKLGIWKDT